MTIHETYITTTEEGDEYILVNGNSQSEETWVNYEDAKEALLDDNKLEKDALEADNPDLYHDNSHINWE